MLVSPLRLGSFDSEAIYVKGTTSVGWVTSLGDGNTLRWGKRIVTKQENLLEG